MRIHFYLECRNRLIRSPSVKCKSHTFDTCCVNKTKFYVYIHSIPIKMSDDIMIHGWKILFDKISRDLSRYKTWPDFRGWYWRHQRHRRRRRWSLDKSVTGTETARHSLTTATATWDIAAVSPTSPSTTRRVASRVRHKQKPLLTYVPSLLYIFSYVQASKKKKNRLFEQIKKEPSSTKTMYG